MYPLALPAWTLGVNQLIEFDDVVQRIDSITKTEDGELIIETTLPFSEWIYNKIQLPFKTRLVTAQNV